MFHREKQAGQTMACVANDATIAVSLRHRGAFALPRQGLFFKRQPELLTGKAQRLGRKMSSKFRFEFIQRRVRSNRKYLDNLIGINGPFRRPIASRQRRRFT